MAKKKETKIVAFENEKEHPHYRPGRKEPLWYQTAELPVREITPTMEKLPATPLPEDGWKRGG